ncbi:MAG: Lcl domain-containing protein, partial [Treponema sp.]
SNKTYYKNSSFSKNGDDIRCYYDFTVKKNPAKTHIEQIKCKDITQETRQKVFDNTHYKPIIEAINSEIKRLKEKKEKDALPFKANLFANQDYNKSLSAKTDEAIHQLEDAEIALNKQHNRYFKASLDAILHEGDVIFKNGLIYSKDEIAKIAEEGKKNIIAVVCISGNKTYALGINEHVMCWEDMKDYASNYGKDLPKEYSTNWKVPSKEELNKIWKNIGTINTSLNTLGLPILSAQGYWSSTEKEDAAFYQMFDEKGPQDHTTKDHEYAVRLIREWDK